MASHARKTTRRYSLRKVKSNRRTDKQPQVTIRLDDDVEHSGCVIKKVESTLKSEWPNLRVHRSGCMLTVLGKKHALFVILDTVVPEAITRTEAIYTKAGNKAQQDRTPERKLKVATLNARTASIILPDVDSVSPIRPATLEAWRDYDPSNRDYPDLKNDLPEIPAAKSHTLVTA